MIQKPLLTINLALPEFDGKRFQNVAKEGVETSDDSKNFQEKMEKKFEPLLTWLKETALREKIENLGDTIKRLKRQLKAYMKKLNEAGGESDCHFDPDGSICLTCPTWVDESDLTDP